jgi:putative membrane protein
LGIYDALLNAVKSFDVAMIKAFLTFRFREALARPHWSFLLPLVAGIFTALMIFTRVFPLPYYIEHYPALVYALFFGMIVGSIFILLADIRHPKVKDFLFMVLGIVIGYQVVTLVPVSTPDHPAFLFLCGAIAICAMILPGISGSFLLLILGKYSYVLSAVGRLDIITLLPFAAGCVVGLALFARFLSWLLHRHRRAMIMTIIGFLIGTLWIIWPFQHREFVETDGHRNQISATPYWPAEWSENEWLSMGLLAAGLLAVVALHGWYVRSQKKATRKVGE